MVQFQQRKQPYLIDKLLPRLVLSYLLEAKENFERVSFWFWTRVPQIWRFNVVQRMARADRAPVAMWFFRHNSAVSYNTLGSKLNQ